MSSINQLISEIAHSVQQAESVPVRRAIRQGIIHARNELIRHTYANHNYVDKVLKQRYRITLIDVPDGDIPDTEELIKERVKRSSQKVPRPVRVANNTPFHSIRTVGVKNPINIPFVTEAVSEYYKHLPGMNCTPTYDYINDYIYINNLNEGINSIIIESIFEYPHEIQLETTDKGEYKANVDDNDEFFIPEDMVNSVKKLVLETMNPEIVRNTNEPATVNLVK